MVGWNISQKVMLIPLAIALMSFKTGIALLVYRKPRNRVVRHIPVLDTTVSPRAACPRRCFMEAGKDPLLDQLGMGHLGSPKALLGKKGVFQDFREFALRGNMLDMAVGIIIGAAFGRIVSSFVSDILMPPIGLFTGRS